MATGNALNANQVGLQSYDGAGTWNGRSITGTSGVIVTNGNGVSGNPTISVSPGGLPTTEVTTATQAMSTNNTYVANRVGGVAFTLPAIAAFGDEFEVIGKGGLWSIAPGSGQQIIFGNLTGTVSTGVLTATNQNDCVRLKCITANTTFIVKQGPQGNLTLS